jgi:hypothetical protein
MRTSERPPRLRFSRHAQLRRKQMKLTEHQVERAVAEPDLTYPSVRGGVLRRLFQRGPIVVVTEDRTREVVTVLWHRKESRDEASAA